MTMLLTNRPRFPWALAAVFAALVVLAFCTGCTHRAAHAGSSGASDPVGGADLNSILLWTVGGGLLGIGLSVGVAIWMHSILIGLAGVGGCGTMVATAVSLKVIQPYLGWFVGGGVLLFAVIAVIVVRKLHLTNTAAVLFGRDMASAHTDAEAALVKQAHATYQTVIGVKPLIDRALAKAKTVRTEPAAAVKSLFERAGT